MLFHFKVIAALCDSQIKWVINHPNCIFNFLFKPAHFVTWLKRKVHVLREITTLFIILIKLQNEQSWRTKWKCNLDDLLLILFMSQKMQLYSENEKAFLLIHFNLNYGTDSLPYQTGQVTKLYILINSNIINMTEITWLYIFPPHPALSLSLGEVCFLVFPWINFGTLLGAPVPRFGTTARCHDNSLFGSCQYTVKRKCDLTLAGLSYPTWSYSCNMSCF